MTNIFGKMIAKHNPQVVYPIKWCPTTGDVRISLNNEATWKLIAENVFNENIVFAALETAIKRIPQLFQNEFTFQKFESRFEKAFIAS